MMTDSYLVSTFPCLRATYGTGPAQLSFATALPPLHWKVTWEHRMMHLEGIQRDVVYEFMARDPYVRLADIRWEVSER